MAVISGGTFTLPNTVGESSYYLQNIVSKTTYGTSGESDTIVGTDKYTSCILHVKIANIAGTSPTLNVYLQQLAADGTTWYDIASLTQITGNGSYVQSYNGGAAQNFTATDKTLAAASVRTVPMGGKQRVALVYGGTNPRTDVTVGIEYIP
jgi:hypothetical protein